MAKFTFEDFLMEKHAEQYIGTKDCMIDDFPDWLEDCVENDEWFAWGDEFQKQVNSELLEACQKVVAVYETVNGIGKDNKLITTVRQAIAKVEGKQ